MKRRTAGLWAAAGLLAAQGCQAAEDQATRPVAAVRAAPSDAPLTPSELAELKSEWSDSKSRRKIVFTADVSVPDADRYSAALASRTPFRIVAEAVEWKEGRFGPEPERLTGSVRIHMTDSAGQVVLSKTVALGLLCPS